jgi:sec-independent protein translocase protein TatA
MQTTILFISGSEIFVILLAILLLFGADKIPEIARSLGKGMKEIKKVTSDLKKDFEKTDVGKDITQIGKEFQDVKKNLNLTNSNINNQTKKNEDLDNSIK